VSADERGGGERGFTDDELLLFTHESMLAVEAVKRTRRAERRARTGLQLAAAGALVVAALLITPCFFRSGTTPPALPAAPAGTVMAQVVFPRPLPDGAPVRTLRTGERMNVPAGTRAVVYDRWNGTRTEYAGATELKVTPHGVETEAVAPTALVSQWAASLRPHAPGVTRGLAGVVPLPLYPVDTSVYPGEVTLEWIYAGEAKSLTLEVEDEAGNLLLSQELEAGVAVYEMEAAPGRAYYWRVVAPCAKLPPFQEFRTLSEAQIKWVSETLSAFGYSRDDIAEGLPELKDAASLGVIYDVLVENELFREAEAVRQRLQEAAKREEPVS